MDRNVMTPEQSDAYREMLRRGLRERRVRPRAHAGGPVLGVFAAAAGAVALLGVAVACGALSLDPLLRIREVQVRIDGQGAITAEQVQDRLAIRPGLTFAQLDWQGALGRLLALPRVQRARISYAWFHRLEVCVEERRACALLLSPCGEALEVSTDAVVLDGGSDALADLPLLTWEPGAGRADLVPGDGLQAPGAEGVLALLGELQLAHPRLWESVSEAHLLSDGSYELYWNDAPTVILGRGRVSPLRIRAWAAVMEDLRRRGDLDVVIDLRLHGQILVRLPGDRAAAQATG